MNDETKDEKRPWAVWGGYEVEGRLKGIGTLFFYCEPEPEPDDPQFDPVKLFAQFDHFFFCSNWIETEGIDLADLANGYGSVTLELKPSQVGIIPVRLLETCHLLIGIEVGDFRGSGKVPWYEVLKPSDSVRLRFAPFTTATNHWAGFLRANPQDYREADSPAWFSSKGLERP